MGSNYLKKFNHKNGFKQMIRVLIILLGFFFIQFAHAVPPLEVYGNLPGIEMMRLSPSGERYAFIVTIGEARRLIVVSDKGETLFATKTGDVKVRDLQWVGEDRILVHSTSTYDNPLELAEVHEFSTFTNIDLRTGKASNIFANDKNVAHFVFGYAGTARIKERNYGYFVGITFVLNTRQNFYEFAGDHRDLYRVDLETNEITRLARGGDGSAFHWVVGIGGSVIAHSEYDNQKAVWRLYAGDNHEKLLLEKLAPFGDMELIGRGRTLGTVWIADSSTGINVAEEVSVADGKRETLFANMTPDEYLSDPSDGMAIGAITLEEPHAIFFDDKLQARINGTRKAFPNLQMKLISFSRNLDRLIVKTDGGNDSGTYWLVNIASKQADPIGYPFPKIHSADVGQTQLITYKTNDGLDIRAVLTLPVGRKAEKLPLVVLPHGGPIGVNDAIGFDWWAQAYASSGYAVLQPNYRGSGGQGKDFIAAGYGQWGRKMQTDLSDGVTALAAQGIIDPKRVCIVGASYGGYAALAGVTLQHDIYRCAVSVAGPSNLPAFFQWQRNRHGRESEATRYWRAVTGADKEGDGIMKALSPTYFAEQANAPILLIHGKDDTVVPIEQSRAMESALKGAKKSVEFVEMVGEDHWLSREETRKAMLKASVAFVQKNNPPD